jgi:hypothetical protein
MIERMGRALCNAEAGPHPLQVLVISRADPGRSYRRRTSNAAIVFRARQSREIPAIRWYSRG